jgi:hypothetical protein
VSRGDQFLIRCSSLGHLVTEPKSPDEDQLTDAVRAAMAVRSDKRSDEQRATIKLALMHSLSAGAKSHVEALFRQDLFGVDLEVRTPVLEKGKRCEAEALELVARRYGWHELAKNHERRSNDWITGEADAFSRARDAGRDIKCAWSIATFPLLPEFAVDHTYLWQGKGYLVLWRAREWHFDHVLVNTPEDLIGRESQSLHFVDHIDIERRVTTWTVTLEDGDEELIKAKVEAARRYYRRLVHRFDETHLPLGAEPRNYTAASPAKPAPSAPAPKPAVEILSADF